MKKNVETWLPLFSGFYNTIWELDTDYILDDNNKLVPFDRMILDNKTWEKDVCEHIIEELNCELSDFSLRMRFQNISSPNYYNFANDSCNVIVDVDEKAISKYIYENEAAFEDYLREKYTSYDGFHSSYSNKLIDWEEDTKRFRDYSEGPHLLGAILQFICENMDIKEMDIRDSLDLYGEEYIQITSLTWDDVDLDQAFIDTLPEIDLEYGDVVFDIKDAQNKAILFSTDWRDELSEEIKIKLIEAEGLTPYDFEQIY